MSAFERMTLKLLLRLLSGLRTLERYDGPTIVGMPSERTLRHRQDKALTGEAMALLEEGEQDLPR